MFIIGIDFDPAYKSDSMILIIILLGCFPLLAIIAIIDFLKKLNLKKYFLITIISIILLIVINFAIEYIQIESLKKRAEIVIVAMNKYYEKNQRYPERLEQLNPEYIKKIPVTNPPMFIDSMLGFGFYGKSSTSSYWSVYYLFSEKKWIESYYDE